MRVEWKWMVVLVLVYQWYSTCYGCWEEERIALLHVQAFLSSPNGTPYFNLTGKESDADCCKWSDQVECDPTTKRVTRLSLDTTSPDHSPKRYLNASLFLPFKELKNLSLAFHGFIGCFQNQGFEVVSPWLSNLEVLDLSFNRFNDSILSSLSGFSSLKSLNLADNMLTGSTNINKLGALSNLEELDLSYNNLENFISPREFNNLTNLENLFFDGSLPSNFLQNIGGLSSLKVLSLELCNLDGTIPDDQGLCELKNLEELHLSRNRLEGLLPACLGNLSSLRLLDVSDNRLQIPVSFNSFMNLSNLMHISCDNNILVAEPTSQNFIPKFQLQFFRLSNCSSKQELPNFLYSQYNLSVLDLSYNNFVGIFPSWLLENNTRIEEAHLEGNLFRGPLQLSYHPNLDLVKLDISDIT